MLRTERGRGLSRAEDWPQPLQSPGGPGLETGPQGHLCGVGTRDPGGEGGFLPDRHMSAPGTVRPGRLFPGVPTPRSQAAAQGLWGRLQPSDLRKETSREGAVNRRETVHTDQQSAWKLPVLGG